MRAAGHLDAAADLLAQYGARTGGSGQDLLIARASLRIDQVQACVDGGSRLCSPRELACTLLQAVELCCKAELL